MTPDDARELVAVQAEKAGGVRPYARLVKLSPAYISDVLRGRRDLGPTLCKRLRLRKIIIREIRYERA